jgi:hypothetical protein
MEESLTKRKKENKWKNNKRKRMIKKKDRTKITYT